MSKAIVESGAEAPWIAVQRSQLLAQRGHAWLLQGPSGLGQYALGLSLVRAWLCEQPSAQGACGQCASCHAIDVRAHADLCVLMPEVQMMELGWLPSEKAQADIDDKKRKPSKESAWMRCAMLWSSANAPAHAAVVRRCWSTRQSR